MKGNTFKKAAALTAAAAMTAQFGFVLPVGAADLDVDMLNSSYTVTVSQDGNTLTIPVTNNSGSESTVTAYAATYSGDVLKSIVLDSAAIAESGSDTLNLTYTEHGENETVKLFVWDANNAPIIGSMDITTDEPAGPELLVDVDYEESDDVLFTAQARFSNELTTSTVEPNTTRVESMIGSGSTNGYGIYTPLTATDAENKIVNFEFDVYFTGRVCYLSLSNGAQRDGTVTNRALTFGNLTDDGQIRIGSASNFGNETVVGSSSNWLHVVASVNNMIKSTELTVYNTTADGDYSTATPTYSGTVAFSDPTLDYVTGMDFFAPNFNIGIMIDNIKISVEDIDVVMRTVTYNVDGTSTTEYVVNGEYVSNVPDTDKTGYIFRGWQVGNDTENIISTETLEATAVTADVTYTAVYESDPAYIEPMASVAFKTLPTGGLLTAGPDADTEASNLIDVSVTGELGTDLIANPDDRAGDVSVTYEIKGFNWKSHEQEPTSDSEEWPYCDSYGRVVEYGDTGIDFQLKNHPFNYYGQVVATVTYNKVSQTITAPLVYIGDSTANTNSLQVLPRGGYYEDFDAYSPDMVGYQAVTSAENRDATDIVTDNWASYGGNTRTLKITEEDGNRFMRLEATGTNSSSFAANQIDAVTDTQVVFDQMVRFHNSGSSILLKSTNPVTWNDNATTFSLTFTGSEINLNGDVITAASADVWYRILITSDVTSGKCYAEVYDEEGLSLGESEMVNFVNAGSVTPTFYMFRTPDSQAGTVDFDKVKITRAALDQESISMTTTNQTIAIPETDGETATATVTVSAETTEGLPAIGVAEWSIANATMRGVTVTPSADDTHVATVTVEAGATPGTLPISVLIGGATQTINLTLTSTQDSVQFSEFESSISIPLSADENVVENYVAEVVNGDGVAIPDKTITYALYDSNNMNPIDAPTGITFENGTLTVTSEARACVVYIRATSTNTEGADISNAVRVDIHGLAFDFGAGTEEDVVSGYTSVTQSSIYSDSAGYGIEGVATAGGSASLEDASTDYLAGSYTFKANVEAGKFYTIKISYTGTLTSEYVNADLAGASLGTSTDMEEKEYTVPVIDDVLDLALSGTDSKIAYIIIEKQDDRQPRQKPHIIASGDSTVGNRGSWGYVLGGTIAEYPELDALATFGSGAMGGVDVSSYYTNGAFRDRVLMNIYPGDYVTIGDIGTNGMGTMFEDDINYYIDACLALGAKVIVNSYSPHGAKAGEQYDYTWCYDSETHTFTGYRQEPYDVIIRQIYEERQDELVGFLEIGKNADAAFNAYVANYEAKGYETMDEAAQAIIDCFTDHNHYSGLASELMIAGYGDVKGIAAQLVDLISADLESTSE